MKFLNSLAVVLALASASAFAAGGKGGEPTGPGVQAAPVAGAAIGSLTYTGLAGTCSNTGFGTTSATGNAVFPGAVSVAGATTLNGVAYDSYSFTLPGTLTYPTGFSRTFAAPLASSTYTFVFQLTVSLGSEVQGTNTVTFSCNAGALSVASVWAEAPPRVVPVGSPALYGLIGMLLVGFAGIALRRR